VGWLVFSTAMIIRAGKATCFGRAIEKIEVNRPSGR